MRFSEREITTILAALRFVQERPDVFEVSKAYHTIVLQPSDDNFLLGREEIDNLCERINLDQEPGDRCTIACVLEDGHAGPCRTQDYVNQHGLDTIPKDEREPLCGPHYTEAKGADAAETAASYRRTKGEACVWCEEEATR